MTLVLNVTCHPVAASLVPHLPPDGVPMKLVLNVASHPVADSLLKMLASRWLFNNGCERDSVGINWS
jgi:hypothetical protein